MSTSGTRTYTYNRNQYIQAALRKSQIVSRFDAAESEDISEAAEALNLLLATLSSRSDGSPNAKFWLRKVGALILDRTSNRYQLGDSSADVAVELDTLVIRDIENAASLTANTTTLNVIINEDFTVSHNVAIHYNDTGLLKSSISDYSSADNVINQPEFAAAGNWLTDSGWTIGSGVATCDGTAGAGVYQDTVLTSGTRYAVLTNVSAYTSGSVAPTLGSHAGTAISATGWNLQFLTADGTTFSLESHATNGFNGSVTEVIVMPITGTLSMTLATPFNRPATSATEAFFYLTEVTKPLKIVTMSRRDRNGTDEDDMPMERWNEAQYQALADKDATGDPTAYWYEEKLASGHLYIDSVHNDMRDILVFRYIPQMQYFTSSSDDLDIPDVGREYIVYALAKRLAGEHNRPWSDTNEQVLQEARAAFFREDQETVRVFFEPDRVDSRDMNGSEFL